jgi:hypothetical protein
MYYATAGGTVSYVDNLDANGPHTPVRLAFYGLASYQADPAAFNSSIYVNTPLTSDTNGDVFFGFRVQGTAPAPLNTMQGGYVRIDPNGKATFVLAGNAAGDVNVSRDSHNLAPALSRDQKTLYVAVKGSTAFYAYLLALDSTTLATKNKVFLNDPRPQTGGTFNPAGVLDDSTASPTVGPDGDVYFGVMGNPFNGSRGWLLHFNSDLTVEKTPGAFGWDDTVAIVPKSMVPSYQGASPYLLFSKYNNYAATSDGGDGVNKIAILDPNATQVEAHASSNGLLVMKEVMTIAGPTPDTDLRNQGFPNAVREWCINAAAVDPATDSVLANSEDGKLYRWDLVHNRFSGSLTLTSGIAEAYTPTMIGADGTIYAINDAVLFAVGGFPSATTTVASSMDHSTYGQRVTFTATVLSAGATSLVPKGVVTFVEGGMTLGTAVVDGTGHARFSTAALRAGTHLIKAEYSGDANFVSSVSSLPFAQSVAQATTTTALKSSINPSEPDQMVTFAARIHVLTPGAGLPLGSVTFFDGVTPLGTRPLVNGVALLATAVLNTGNHSVTAIYSGSNNFAGSTSPIWGQSVQIDAHSSAVHSESASSRLVSDGLPFPGASTSLAVSLASSSSTMPAPTGAGRSAPTLPTAAQVDRLFASGARHELIRFIPGIRSRRGLAVEDLAL